MTTLRCQLFGHRWRDQNGEEPPIAVWGSGFPWVVLEYRCERCGETEEWASRETQEGTNA